MQPILFTIGKTTIYSHGFFLLLGLLTGTGALILEARRRRWPKEEAVPIVLAAFVGGMFGARVSMIIFYGIEVAPVALNMFPRLIPEAGVGSILGGVVGAYLAGYIASRAIGKDSCSCDAFAPAMALAIAVGRIGCYMAGEDGIGKATNFQWGVPAPDVEYLVHPSPLYESAFNLLWFAVLMLLRDHPRLQDGRLLKFGLAGYTTFRFFVEYVRNHPVFALGLTWQQWFCIVLAVGILLLDYNQRRRKLDLPAGRAAV